tara:strand:+ start:249 stop:1100 length:852 start_codon:yes stop_codon:yes gene_type:complete
MIQKGKTYLVTGGTGIIGVALCNRIIDLGGNLVVLSRNKSKLDKLKQKHKNIKVIPGDISNPILVKQAMEGIDGIFHLAALAQGMQSGKPTESINTNILGSINILQESLNNNLDFVLGISSDKAVQISGVYGATKFLMEKLFLEFEDLNPKTNYRIVRLGNVVYSIDSVLYKWKNLIQNGKELIITDPNATRFWISVNESINIIIECLQQSNNSTPYYKSMKSSTMGNLLKAMVLKYSPKDKKSPIKIIGLQPGENQHEKISDDSPPSNQITQYNIKELIELI